MSDRIRSEARGWCRQAPFLAAWAQRRGLTQGLAHLSPTRRGGTPTMVAGPPSDGALVAHFQSKSPKTILRVDPRIASVSLGSVQEEDPRALWFVLDLAASDPSNEVSPGERFQAAITWVERLDAIGIDARLEDADRHGGLRIWAFLAQAASSSAVANLVKRLTWDHQALGVPVPRLDPDPSAPGWVRLPGFDPVSGQWPQIMRANGQWLKGEEAAQCLIEVMPAESSRLAWQIPTEEIESEGIERPLTTDGRQWITAFEREAADAIIAEVDAALPPPKSATIAPLDETSGPMSHHIADLAAKAEAISRSRFSAA